MLRQDLLTHLFASLVDVRVEFVAILLDGKLLVVVNRNENLLRAVRLVVRVVELSHVRVLQGLLSGQSLAWVELEKALQQVQSVVTGRREHVSQLLSLGRRQRLKHGLRKRAVDRVNVLLGRAPCDLHDAIKLVKSGRTREDRLAKKQLGQDAAHAPHVNALGVLV